MTPENEGFLIDLSLEDKNFRIIESDLSMNDFVKDYACVFYFNYNGIANFVGTPNSQLNRFETPEQFKKDVIDMVTWQMDSFIEYLKQKK